VNARENLDVAEVKDVAEVAKVYIFKNLLHICNPCNV